MPSHWKTRNTEQRHTVQQLIIVQDIIIISFHTQKKTLYDSMYYECEEYLDTQDNAYAYNSTYARTAYIECTGMSKEDLWEVVWIFTLSNPQYFFCAWYSSYDWISGFQTVCCIANLC